MDKKDKQKENLVDESLAYYPYADIENIVSSTDCTGLIPTPPVSQTEAESYAELYSIPKPSKEAENHKRSGRNPDSVRGE